MQLYRKSGSRAEPWGTSVFGVRVMIWNEHMNAWGRASETRDVQVQLKAKERCISRKRREQLGQMLLNVQERLFKLRT